MKIAITGATGGLGRNLVEHFLAQGHEVTALGRNTSIGQQLQLMGAQFRPGDLSDKAYLKKSLGGHQAVVHSAALAAPWGPWQDFERSNVQGTANVLRCLRGQELKKFVHISTPSIYYAGRAQTQIPEDAPLPKPLTSYARSKIMAEELVLEAVREHQLPAVLLRPRAIFGPYDAAVLPRILRLMQKGFFPLPDGGQAQVDVTAVHNVAHAVDLSLQASSSCTGRAYNITNGQSMSVAELLARVARALELKVRFASCPSSFLRRWARLQEWMADHLTHREPSLTQYSVGLLSVSQTLDIDRARQELGYRPQIDVDEGLQIYAKWWKHQYAR